MVGRQTGKNILCLRIVIETPSHQPNGMNFRNYRFEERPFLVFWEITRSCALACRHCRAVAQPGRHPDELDEAEAMRVMEQLAELRPPMVVLTGGDPLMRPDVLDLARRGTELGLHMGLSPAATARVRARRAASCRSWPTRHGRDPSPPHLSTCRHLATCCMCVWC